MPNRDKVALILAGGQIIHKSLSDSEVVPVEKEELLAYLAEDMKEAVYVVDWSYQPICHYTLRMCGDLIRLAGTQIAEGASGVVIPCGTQALDELAYFADLVWSYPQPLVFTSSIYYAGSSGTETSLHLSQAIKAASSQASWGQGALICVQDEIYAASEFVQISNYRRAGYSGLRGGGVAEFVEPGGRLSFLRAARRGKILDIETSPVRNVEVLHASLGGGDVLLNSLVDGHVGELDGLVFAAFGGGDVPPSWVPLLRKILRENVPVVLVSRVPVGRVQLEQDFEGGVSRLLDMGLISGGLLTPLQARIRLALGLGAGFKDAELRSYMLGE